MTVNLLTDYHLGFISLNGGCTSSSESTLVKMPHCWKSHVAAHISLIVSTVFQPAHAVLLLVAISRNEGSGKPVQTRLSLFYSQTQTLSINIDKLRTKLIILTTVQPDTSRGTC